MAFPYFGYYNATKHALEASYEALWYECRGSDIQIKIIEPGFTQTNFATHGMQMSGETNPYHVNGLSWLAQSMRDGTTATPPRDRPSDCQRLIRQKEYAEISRKAQWQPVVIAKAVTRQLVSGTHLSSSPTRTKIDVSLRPRGQLFS